MTASSDINSGGAILALDVGKRRIGLAVSDACRNLARGLRTLERERIREDLDKLKNLAAEWDVTLLLIGRPLHMSGREARQTLYTEEFAERLSIHCELPIVFWDERLSSAHAERLLREAGTAFDRTDGAVDRVAAVLLLESYLAYLRIKAEEEHSNA